MAAGGVGHAMVSGLDSGVRRVDPFDGLSGRPQDKDSNGVNFLVAGTDGRGGLSQAQRKKYRLGGTACDCTDTLMLVHLSADRDRASVVSLPRDSYTKLPAHTDEATGEKHENEPAKLNSAYAHGGPKLTVSTVERMTGVHVDHYLEIDFNSFMSTVDVVGGVPVCTEKPLKDKYSGLDLPKGTTKLNGGQALQYVRARHLDGASDLGRMERQQQFLASLIDKVTDSGLLMNPVKFNRLTTTMLRSVRADRGFGGDEMLALGRAMRGFTAASSEFASVPVGDPDHRVPGLGSTVKWDRKKSAKIFGTLREDLPLAGAKPSAPEKRAGAGDAAGGPGGKQEGTKKGPRTVEVAPDSIRVQVENGTAKPGLGHRADQDLRRVGFDTTGTARNATGRDAEHTVIAYDPRWDKSARSLAAAVPGAELAKDPGRGPVMRVTVGEDYKGAERVRQAAPTTGGAGAPQGGEATRGDKVTCS